MGAELPASRCMPIESEISKRGRQWDGFSDRSDRSNPCIGIMIAAFDEREGSVVNIQEVSRWLQSTSACEWLQSSTWVIPTLQTVHILGVCVVMSSIAMLTLRLLGMVGRSWPLSEVTHRFLPWVWGALLVLLLSGATLILADPERELSNEVFWAKMAVLVGAVAMTALFQIVAARGTGFLARSRFAAGVTAALWLLLWMGTAAAGRWIAYFERG